MYYLETVKASMRLIAEGLADSVLDLSSSDWDLLRRKSPWLAPESVRAVHALEQSIYGVMEAQGLRRMDAPAEVYAAAILFFVEPCNVMAACHHVANGLATSEAIISGTASEPVRPRLLLSMVLQCAADAPAFRDRFELRTQQALDASLGVAPV